MLKKIRENLDGLSDELKALYEQKPDGKFHLKLEDDDAEPLRRAKEHEVGLRKIAEQERDAAIAERDAAKSEAAKLREDAGKDVNKVRDELRAEYEDKERKLTEKHTKEKTALENSIKKIFVSDVATRLASEITDVPDLIVPLMAQRLSVEMVDGEPVTRVLSADGKASAMTPDELRDEYLQNPKYARIMRANESSGGGASGGNGGSGAPKKLDDMSSAERAEMAKRDPAGFQRLVDAAKQAARK